MRKSSVPSSQKCILPLSPYFALLVCVAPSGQKKVVFTPPFFIHLPLLFSLLGQAGIYYPTCWNQIAGTNLCPYQCADVHICQARRQTAFSAVAAMYTTIAIRLCMPAYFPVFAVFSLTHIFSSLYLWLLVLSSDSEHYSGVCPHTTICLSTSLTKNRPYPRPVSIDMIYCRLLSFHFSFLSSSSSSSSPHCRCILLAERPERTSLFLLFLSLPDCLPRDTTYRGCGGLGLRGESLLCVSACLLSFPPSTPPNNASWA